MLINKDHDNAHPIRVLFRNDSDKGAHAFAGPVDFISFGKAQYEWHSARRNGYADPDNPPVRSNINATNETVYTLPAASVTVLRGHLN